MKKFILAVWVMLPILPTFTPQPILRQKKGIEKRIKWAIMSCGHMLKIMIIGLKYNRRK